jgi:hypothetical protein
MEEEPMSPAQDTRQPMFGAATRVLLVVTIIVIVLYWGSIFSGMVTVEAATPGYVDWFMAFFLADSWIATAALVSLLLSRRNGSLAAVFLAAAGSALIFLGLNAFSYGYRTGLLFNLTTDEVVEIAIKIYCLTVGAWFLSASYRRDARMSA